MSSPDEISRIREENFAKAVEAIRRDDLDALKDVLSILPEFNTMVDRVGQNLLTLSCEFKNKKAFDYLLSLNCFNLEAVDRKQCTVLHLALNSRKSDYIGVKLINAGVDVYKVHSHRKWTYLHYAIYHKLLKSAKLLLQKGANPNARDWRGYTPLHLLLNARSSIRGVGEVLVDLLLQYGADTAIYDKNGYLPFDYAVIRRKTLSIQEHLFYCTFDSHSADYEMQTGVLKKLLDAPRFNNVSPLFDNVMDVVSEMILVGNCQINFFSIPPYLLKEIVKKCRYAVEEAFSSVLPFRNLGFGFKMNINSMEILLNSELHFETMELIRRMQLWKICLDNHCEMSGEELSNLILYLLSYGVNVNIEDCKRIYKSKGYCDVLKTMLLHLNYEKPFKSNLLMLRIMVDIRCDLNTILAKFNFSRRKIEPVLDYFANPQLRILCERSGDRVLINKVKQLPAMPSLLQLARDETRRHIVRRYNLQKTSQYYWVLRKIFFGTAYEEILSFKTKLYG